MVKRKHDIPFDYFQVFTFGSGEDLEAVFGTLEEAERVWRSVRDGFLARWDLWGMPEAWWRFEPGVPDELRSVPSAILTGTDASELERVEQARRRYLVSIGIDPKFPRRHAPFGSD